MQIEPAIIPLRELASEYMDNDDAGVTAYGGKLDIRPPYQREFVYNEKQRNAVIDSITKNYPLNIMYWAVRADGGYEIIDGQQRTISICQYINGDFSFEGKYFHNLQNDEQEKILNYEVTVYKCSGTDSERLEWFKIINIAGARLTDQELRNAVYHGPWLTDAKKYFSKTGCPAYQIGSDYLTGKTIRQEFLETAIKWISSDNIEEYMAQNQNKPTAIELWNYYQSIISWIDSSFPTKRKKMMQGLPWGQYYNEYKNLSLNPDDLEEKIKKLIADNDVDNNRGIYLYLLSGEEKHLSIRKFDDEMKQRAYERQNGICTKCKEHFDLEEMDADHIRLWKDGGKTNDENCQVLCVPCNRGG